MDQVKTDAAYAFAKNIVNTRYEDLPREVVEVTKKNVLDMIGVMLGASGMGEEEKIKEIVDLVKDGKGKKESTIIAFGGKTSSWMAAFANGALCHVLDYDDSCDNGGAHPTSETLPGALAVAERAGGVTGKDFITALALGIDLAARLGMALNQAFILYGWLGPALFGYFATAAAASKLLGLKQDQIVDAFGLALDQAAGSAGSPSGTGSVFRAIRDGFSAKGGVLAALLAERGVAGNKHLLEGKNGFYNLYFKGEYDPNKLTANLGRVFEGINVSFKPWPSGRCTHASVTGVLDILNEHDIKPENIESILVTGGIFCQTLFQCATPQALQRPQSSIDAKVSMPFIVGAAAAHSKVVLDTFTSQGRNDPLTLEMAQKVTFSHDSRFSKSGYEGDLTEIRTKDGKRYSKEVEFAYGHPQNPMSMPDLIAKFKDCVSHSVKPMPESKVERLIQTVDTLDQLKDVSQLAEMLG